MIKTKNIMKTKKVPNTHVHVPLRYVGFCARYDHTTTALNTAKNLNNVHQKQYS